MYSFVIEIASDANKAVEKVNTIPILGFNSDKVGVEIAGPDPTKISVIFDNIFSSFKILYFFYNVHYHF